MPPAFVMILVRPSATNGSARDEVRGEVARVAARLVALAVLLEDRERQLGERFEAQVVDAFREQRVDRGRRVAVEALTSRDRDHGQAWTGGSAVGPRPRALRAGPRPGSARPRGTARATSCTPIGRPGVAPVQRNRHRRLAGDVERRGVRRERDRAGRRRCRRRRPGGRCRRARGGGSASVGVSKQVEAVVEPPRRRCGASSGAARSSDVTYAPPSNPAPTSWNSHVIGSTSSAVTGRPAISAISAISARTHDIITVLKLAIRSPSPSAAGDASTTV